MQKNRGNEWILPALTSGADPKASPEEYFPEGIRQANLHLTRIWYDFRGTAKTAVASKARNYEDELVRLAGDLLEWPSEKYGSLATVWEREQLRRRRQQAKVAFAIATVLIASPVPARPLRDADDGRLQRYQGQEGGSFDF